MIITPQGFWLHGKPHEILMQLKVLRKGCYYVKDLLDNLYPKPKSPQQ